MEKNDCCYVGRIVKSFGYKGQVMVLFNQDTAETFAAIPSLFIELEGELVPFFLEDFQIRGDDTALVRFDDISSESQAKHLLNRDLYIPRDALPGRDHAPKLATWIEGYKVFDQRQGYIGDVRDLISLKEQELLKVAGPVKEILIPAVEPFIIRIDKRRREIHLDLPEGLLDLNP
ncbi:MAG TPA: ribosome maturation factor RimM [Bacteroidales bacterium]|nr:ribosome maturation factor RimM [Bacteroidales bacterium]HNS45933.1 ribosome maturation factor RimM [Bacteroidales bacterium]